MMKKTLACVAVCSMVAGIASAATVWNPAANGITPPDQGNWNDAANWTGIVPDAVEKAVFNVPGAAEAIVTDLQAGAQLVQGDNNEGGTIRIMAGGTLSTKAAEWSAVGYNNTAHTIVDAGGTMNFGGHAWIGLNDGGVGTLDISGTVTVAQMLGLGWAQTTSQGFVNIYDGGVLELQQIHGDGASSIKHGSLIDIIGTGKITKTSNFVGVFEAYAANNLIAGDGVLGAISATFDEATNLTTVVAIPEPGTLGLMGVFGAAIFFKRRISRK